MHKMEIDDSFLYDEDLRDFKPDEDNPTYIVIDEDNKIKAVASLIADEYNRRGKKAASGYFTQKYRMLSTIICSQSHIEAYRWVG